MPATRRGPLAGVKIVEMAGIGPTPMCAMLLADLGATVIRVDRAEKIELGIKRPIRFNLLNRSRHVIDVDLKSPAAKALMMRLVEKADALIEGFRPGAMERLGLGPDDCLKHNPRLVYGRMTGWGQNGPLATTAGHDINYIAITGALDAIGEPGRPPSVPLNLIGDLGGGALYLALGLVAAILEARTSGHGQVVDAAIVDGVVSLLTTFHGLHGAGLHRTGRGANLLDGGAFFYGAYACADGLYVAIGPIEQRFQKILLDRLKVDLSDLPDRNDPNGWPEARRRVAAAFAAEPRDHWAAVFEATDGCVSPVLSLEEAPLHPHLRARGAYVEVDGVIQSAPAPRFSRTPSSPPTPPEQADARAALAGWLAEDEINEMLPGLKN